MSGIPSSASVAVNSEEDGGGRTRGHMEYQGTSEERR